ncbi:MAG: molybdenum cofactor guanylyltransferase [Planctomycetes bacterium]|nr:molybdenum cofactor guanylyltransferase [Planctomycetota bacterium]
MGSDKATMRLGDRTLTEHVIQHCGRGARSIRLATGPADRKLPRALEAFSHHPDRFPGRGPLGGIDALLRGLQTEWLLVLPCDMPYLTTDDLAPLFEAMADPNCDAAHFMEGEHLCPFPLILHRRAADAVEHCLSTNDNAVRAPLARLRVLTRRLEASLAARLLRNLNHPDEFEGAVKDFAG